MYRKLLLIILWGSLVPSILAQQFDYGNDWYIADPDRPFIKLLVAKTGIYRATATDLSEAGYDLAGIDLATLQLFHKGREVPIYMSQNASSQLQFIEFWGERNDGELDTLLYRDPLTRRHRSDLQPDRDISIFTDTAAYFLTWGKEMGKRYLPYTNFNYNRFTPEPHFSYRAKLTAYPGTGGVGYHQGGGGANDPNHVLNSDYGVAEGYLFRSNFNPNQARNFTLPTPGAVESTLPIQFQTRVTGISNGTHDLQVTLNGESIILLDTAGMQDIYIRSFERTISTPLQASNTLTYRASDASSANNNYLCWAAMVYTRNWNFEIDSTMEIYQWQKDRPAYFEINQISGTDSIFVYDRINQVRSSGLIVPTDTLPNGRVVIPPVNTPASLFLTSDKGILTPKIAPHRLSNLHDPNNGAEFVIIAHPSLATSAQAYAQYRDTATANPLSARVVFVDQIYDEYSYGSVTPWAIKRFCKDALDNWEVKPQYFLLWGKGRIETRSDHPTMVPSYGFPATDHEFVSRFELSSSILAPEAAIGRVNVYNDQEGINYLEKVKDYEYQRWEPWMKNAVFLGGGATESEQRTIENTHQNGITRIAQDPYGSDVTYFQKRSGEEDFDPTNSPYHDKIDEGTLLVHFFGHSTANILDVNIRNPNEYNNFGRYPFMIAMGCYGGNFVGGRSFGENWIVQPNRGAIGYLANSSRGFNLTLSTYSNLFYQNWFDEKNTDSSIGELIQGCIANMELRYPQNSYYNTARQMNLQGDPAIKLYQPSLPDFELTDSDIFFYPETFTTQDDSFQINIVLANQARVSDQDLSIEIKRTLPNGSSSTLAQLTVASPTLSDTVSLWLTNDKGNEAIGANTFQVKLDYTEAIPEYDEDNNQAEVSVAVPGNIAQPLFPAPLSIAGKQPLKLVASAFFSSLEDSVRYLFEIDSVASFNSPRLTQSDTVWGTAYNASWEVPFMLTDSATYFWRVRLVDAQPSIWRQSSFTFLGESAGWAQTDLAQFDLTSLQDLTADVQQGLWQFQQLPVDYTFSTRRGGSFILLRNNNVVANVPDRFFFDAVVMGVYDPVTFEPRKDNIIFGGGIQLAIIPQDLHKIKETILNAQTGDYILLANTRNPKVHLWDEQTFDALKLIGVSNKIRTLENGDPFLILGRKGSAHADVELYEPNVSNKLEVKRRVYNPKDDGVITSSLIGPSLRWDQFFFNWNSIDEVQSDSIDFNIYGVDPEVSDTLLMRITQKDVYDLSHIDPQQYPFLRVEAHLKDYLRKTAPQFEHWYVTYDPVPDLVVDPETLFSFDADTLAYGDTAFLQMAARNLTSTPTDSIRIRFMLRRPDRSEVTLSDQKIAPVPGLDVQTFTYEFPTLETTSPGENELFVELNPLGEQREQYYFNNIYQYPFYLAPDQLNPLIDVLVDARRITDGEVVSPRPTIQIQIDDESVFIPIEDTSNFELYFGEAIRSFALERIFPGDQRLQWQPAVLPENKAIITFQPGYEFALPDNTYMLRIQGKDASGNFAGKQFYEVTFRVDNNRSLTPVTCFPNPFTHSTRFTYTLTGEVLPEVFKLHIYSLYGQKVKVIDFIALEEVRSGYHITRYAWDGTDDQGNPLAPGVYVFKMEVNLPDGYEFRTAGSPSYREKGWGKVYIHR